MPQNRKNVRRRLQQAALELYRDRGYEQTTSAEIAAKAGVTERTFFRHFHDKREVLFDGEASLSAILTHAARQAPCSLGPWATLLRAFQAAELLLIENRPFSEPRRRIIAGSPALQERELAKTMSLTAKLTSVLCERRVAEPLASLAAQVGMAAFGKAFLAWLDSDSSSLDQHLVQAFAEVHALSSLENSLPVLNDGS